VRRGSKTTTTITFSDNTHDPRLYIIYIILIYTTTVQIIHHVGTPYIMLYYIISSCSILYIQVECGGVDRASGVGLAKRFSILIIISVCFSLIVFRFLILLKKYNYTHTHTHTHTDNNWACAYDRRLLPSVAISLSRRRSSTSSPE